MIEQDRDAAPAQLEEGLRSVLRDRTVAVLYWSESVEAGINGHFRQYRPRPACAIRPPQIQTASIGTDAEFAISLFERCVPRRWQN